MKSDQAVTRRGFLLAAGGMAVASTTTSRAVAQESTTHTVDMTDELVYDPDDLTIAPGDTIEWVNVGNVGHSITAYEDQIPEEAEYFASGDHETEEAARQGYPSQGDVAGGESYEHTFEVTGTYEYFCIPHESAGMIGTITVQEGGGGDGGGDNGGDGDDGANGDGGLATIPDSAKTIGVAVFVAMMATLTLTFFFLKYGGGQPDTE